MKRVVSLMPGATVIVCASDAMGRRGRNSRPSKSTTTRLPRYREATPSIGGSVGEINQRLRRVRERQRCAWEPSTVTDCWRPLMAVGAFTAATT